MEIPTDIIWLMLFHILDMVFTILIIRRAEQKFENAADSELNFHRYFFRKFGAVKGGLISSSISIPIVFVAGILAYNIGDKSALYFITGLQLGIAYVNFQTWVSLLQNKELTRKCDKKVIVEQEG